MDDELLSLKWNNHQTTFLKIISNLRSKDSYTDATLACNGKFYSVHRFVLSSCSSYFCSIFDQVVSKNLVIVLKDITCKTLEYLLDYMYNGEINVRQNELASLVKAAECLRIKGLAVADDVETFTSNKSSKRLKTNNFSEGNKVTANHQIASEYQDLNKYDDRVKKLCSTESEKQFSSGPSNSNDSSKNEKENVIEKIVKQEPTEDSKLSGDNDWTDSNNIKYEEENLIMENLTTNEMRILNNEEFSVSAPGSSSSHNGKLQWESVHQSGSNLENSSSTFSNCLATLQDLPDFLTDESALRASEIYHENSGLLLQSALDGFSRKSVFGKLANMRENVFKTLKCKHCLYSCHDASNFKRHMQTHTGEKPYKCSFCNYRCIHSSNLKSHIRYKHT